MKKVYEKPEVNSIEFITIDSVMNLEEGGSIGGGFSGVDEGIGAGDDYDWS